MQNTRDTSVNEILQKAIENLASDIHLEPERNQFKVRFRIDGILHLFRTIDKLSQESIISQVKVLSNMNITEHRYPQDGHFEFFYNNVLYNFRVSSLPTSFGENIVMRILNREDALLKLQNTGLEEDQLELLEKLLQNTSGFILITGPTSSGKTNLIYSILDSLNNPEKNIITLEDPIEYQMEGVRQTQINEIIGFSFLKALRSVVRQDPDVLMLGEIRDDDTARLAIQASLIGTLVLSTFHTFDVPALVTRFIEMGITNSVIAQSVRAVIATRLVRKICEVCKEPYNLSLEEKNIFGQEAFKTYIGKGCSACKETGYRGRTGIYEITYFDDEIKSCIIEKQPASYFHNFLKKKQTHTMKNSAIHKVKKGVTSLSEVARVLGISFLTEEI